MLGGLLAGHRRGSAVPGSAPTAGDRRSDRSLMPAGRSARAGSEPDWPALGPALPAVVREGLVGLGHLVGVLAALDGRAEAIAGIEDLVHQLVGHRLLAARL